MSDLKSKRPLRISSPRLRYIPPSQILNGDEGIHQRLLNSEFITASAKGQTEKACSLLSRGAEVDATDIDGNTALHHVSIRGFTTFGEILIDSWKASLKIQNNLFLTPIAVAAGAGRMNTVGMLAAKYKDRWAADDFISAARIAEERKHVELAKMLRRIADQGTGALRIARSPS